MSWTLKYNGTTQSLAEWGFSDLRRIRSSGMADEVTFEAPGDYDSEPLAYRAAITIYRDGARWFQGQVVTNPASGAVPTETIRYTLKGPWDDLERVVFEQEWTGASGTYTKSRVLLGLSRLGSRQTCGTVIQEALDWAIAQGAAISYVASELSALDITPPSSEEVDVTVAEVILRMLAWHKDVAAWVDYAPDTPLLHFAPRETADALGAAVGSDEIGELEVTRRDDLTVRGVVVKYERDNTVDGNVYTSVTTDSAGEISGLDILRQTVALEGSRKQYLKQKVTTASLESDAAIKTKVFEAANTWLSGKSWTIKDGTLTYPVQFGDNPHKLVEGQVQDWMEETVADGLFTCTAVYTDDEGSEREQKISAEIRITSASTNTYRKTSSFTPGEPVPVGLAQKLYDQLSESQYQGLCVYLEEEIAVDAHPGQVINATGGWSEWASMRALIQQVREDVDQGRTEITFGPAEHLNLQDFIELLRANRTRIIVEQAAERQNGTTGDETELSGSSQDTRGGAEPGDALPARPDDYEDRYFHLIGRWTGSGDDVTRDLLWVPAVDNSEESV